MKMGKVIKFSVQLLLVIFFTQIEASAQLSQCKAVLKNDTLALENSKLRRTFAWNNGELQHISLFNKTSNQLLSGQVANGKAKGGYDCVGT